MSFLLKLPVWLSFLIVILLAAGVAVLGLKIVRRKFSEDILKQHHEVAGFIFNAFGLIYAVLLAFVVFATWSDYDESKLNVEKEANELADLYLDAASFPDTLRNNVRQALLKYAQIVYNTEWNYMEKGERDPQALIALHELWLIYSTVDYSKISNPAAYQESLKHLNDFAECRRLRLWNAVNTIPEVIWVVLIIGGLISLFYTYFFATRNVRAQYVMTSALTITNALILFLIYILDHPFVGTNAIGKEPFEMLIKMMMNP